jgi:hypothetical protein
MEIPVDATLTVPARQLLLGLGLTSPTLCFIHSSNNLQTDVFGSQTEAAVHIRSVSDPRPQLPAYMTMSSTLRLCKPP